jgi:Ring finger domain
MDPRVSIFNVQLLDDLHNYFPDILYNSNRFETVQDLLRYIQEQTRTRFNLYDAGRNRYMQGRNVVQQPDTGGTVQPTAAQPIATRPTATQPTATQSTAAQPTQSPLRELLTGAPRLVPSRRNHVSQFYFPLNPLSYTEDIIMNDNTSSIINLLVQGLNNQEPVVVRPTQEQITSATSVQTISAALEDPCAICQEIMDPGTVIRKINACEHSFHVNCIDTWFRRSVNCPNCRADIRE